MGTIICACGSSRPLVDVSAEPNIVADTSTDSDMPEKTIPQTSHDAEEAARQEKQRKLKLQLQILLEDATIAQLPGFVDGLKVCSELDFDPQAVLEEYEYMRFADPNISNRRRMFDDTNIKLELQLVNEHLEKNGTNPVDLHRLIRLYNDLYNSIYFIQRALRTERLATVPTESFEAKKMREQLVALQEKAATVADACIQALRKVYADFPEYEKRSEIVFTLAYELYHKATYPNPLVTDREAMLTEAMATAVEYLSSIAPDDEFAGNAFFLQAEWRRTVENDMEGAVVFYKNALYASFSNNEVARWARIRLAEALVLTGDYQDAEAQYALSRKHQKSAYSEERQILCTSLVRSATIIAEKASVD
ncbi:MAG: hypothetical protein JXX14_05560 [Deltaproteobacteria bacterium]|nr:hypothetical protein [Deltaproteobacteria bacterium]